jgi:hypothetical protein
VNFQVTIFCRNKQVAVSVVVRSFDLRSSTGAANANEAFIASKDLTVNADGLVSVKPITELICCRSVEH